jgi:hypothetical protein
MEHWSEMRRELAWLQALHDPTLALPWSLGEWEHVVRLARRLRLLARLAARIDGAALMDSVPPQARKHLLAELRLSHWRIVALEWGLDRIGDALTGEPYPRVLLKGAAYIGQGLAVAAGRMPSDVDILVPRAHLAAAQGRLTNAGWQEVDLDEHDRRYYREWSHEVPPMRHPVHRVELDLHHNILPPVARTRVDAGLLLAHVQPSKWPGWQVLQPVDQVLHSAAHLFFDSEARDRVRDLVDLDGLLRHFGPEAGFWDALATRSRELKLTEPLALAAHFCVEWLGTPMPAGMQARVGAGGPSALRRAWLLPVLSTVLTPTDPDDRPPWTQGMAAVIFLARYHWGRMPMRILLPHLWHKLRARGADAAAPIDGGA